MFKRPEASGAPAPVYCCQDDGMIGLGVGARSYTRSVHYSSEWAVGARGVREIIDRWIVRPDEAFAVADYGFVLGPDEQRRRWLILSLLSDDGLDVAQYRARFESSPEVDFPKLAELYEGGFATGSPSPQEPGSDFVASSSESARTAIIRLTPAGLARADAIGPWLFSDDVRDKMLRYQLT
jgi:oxygen-independent coproporphyrinogen-3 oxidase